MALHTREGGSSPPARQRLFSAVAAIAISVILVACTQVPGRVVRFEPTPAPVVQAMLELARIGPDDVVMDLGSGDGRIPIAAARDFAARGIGVDIDPALVRRARANAEAAGVLFLHPQPNLDLRDKLRRELPAGARVVSYMWDMGDWPPDDVRRQGRHSIFLWSIPATQP